MKKPTAVILAAGRGTRLAGLNGDRPKGLLPVLGTTFIGRAVDILQASGISDIVIVTGHAAEHFDRFAATRGGVRTAFNPDYAVTGAMQSLHVGLAASTGSCIVLDADIVYEARAVSELLQSPSESVLALSTISTLGDENLAWLKPDGQGGKRMTWFSKNRATQPEPPEFEHVGIIKLSAALCDDLRAKAAAMIAASPAAAYEDCLNHFVEAHAITGHFLPELVWTEVDDETMWRHAEKETFPRLAACDAALVQKTA